MSFRVFVVRKSENLLGRGFGYKIALRFVVGERGFAKQAWASSRMWRHKVERLLKKYCEDRSWLSTSTSTARVVRVAVGLSLCG